MTEMTETPTEREKLLEAALRVALRRAGGVVVFSQVEAARRDHEGPLRVERTPSGYLFEAEIGGHLPAEIALDILEAIDGGRDPIVEHDDWADVYAGNVRFATKAGHQVWIFNDCGNDFGGWDYVDAVQHSDGRRWEYGDEPGSYGGAGDWTPKHDDRWPIPPCRPLRADAAEALAVAADVLHRARRAAWLRGMIAAGERLAGVTPPGSFGDGGLGQKLDELRAELAALSD